MANTIYDLWCLAYALPRVGETDVEAVSVLTGESPDHVLVTTPTGSYSWTGHKKVWRSALLESLRRVPDLPRYSDKIGEYERAARFEIGDWNPPAQETSGPCFVFDDPEQDDVGFS